MRRPTPESQANPQPGVRELAGIGRCGARP